MRAITIAVSCLALLLWAGPLSAAAPATEQAFLDAYKKAYVAGDKNAIAALVHTEGANPVVLDFYLSLLTSDIGKGELSLELRPLTADDTAEAARLMPGPGGGVVKLTPTAYKKLVITVEIRNATTITTNTSTVYVADEGNRIRIAAPADVR